VFKLSKPNLAEVEDAIAVASPAEVMRAEYLSALGDQGESQPHARFAHDMLRTRIGAGNEAFERAIQGFQRWTQFDLGWVRVANPRARIEIGQIVAVEVQSLGLWSVNLSQIVEVRRTDSSFGFLYKTTRHHVEEGEERFALVLDPASNEVWYETEAVSRPRNFLARLGYPVTRAFQHRFARDSHRRMGESAQILHSGLDSAQTKE
jgi:uncharacterized protein (UPF0548 family)